MSYVAPLKDMLFNIKHLADIEQVAQLPGFEDAGFDTAQAVLEGCVPLEIRAAADIDSDDGQGLVHRKDEIPGPVDAPFVAQGFLESGADD